MITFKGYKNGGASVDSTGKVISNRIMVYHFNAAETAIAVLAMPEIPDINDQHPDDTTLLVSKINISEPQGDPKSGKYEVTVEYARTSGGMAMSILGNTAVEPWKQPPYNISSSSASYVVPFQKAYDNENDTNGDPSIPVLNSAGDPFEDSTTTENAIIKFTYNIKDFNPWWPVDYKNRINKEDETVLDIPLPRLQACIRNLSGVKQKQLNSKGKLLYEYWVVDVEIELSKNIFNRQFMNRGLFFIDFYSDPPLKQRIYKRTDGKEGVNFGIKTRCGTNPIPCEEPQRLNENGDLLDETGSDDTVETTYSEYWDKFRLSWKPLCFPKASGNQNVIQYGSV